MFEILHKCYIFFLEIDYIRASIDIMTYIRPDLCYDDGNGDEDDVMVVIKVHGVMAMNMSGAQCRDLR